MKNILVFLLSIISTTVLANELGKSTYQNACQNCHAPQLAKGLNAPAAFDKKAWNKRFKDADRKAKKHPSQFKTGMDYLLYNVKIGKGLMHHGGLCKEAEAPNNNCSDEALIQAINYMAGK
ncbi:c-type cytochrome [Legionella cardiaca]|uniref:C-type cytochrome n=1 Tax=Legionella cardiaca TaxID=1071983 RepID=A0ABY8AQ90_9GAMM|nr:c-type cytochrome [Legionella cardiaca]WED42386.1 c-type cytochrome [Legionella cardiaca]